ncbi:MAG: MBOAT family protein, partial [Flavobacteriales bacterium]|nr:MBOAT family protein [Flavobacteriales bacterium]
MVFSSPIFVFAFLPLVLIVYYLSARPFRNVILLVFSLLFYAWGESERLAVMLLSISLNYVAAILIDKITGQTSRKAWLVMGMIANYYKYTFFAISNYNVIAQSIGWHTWAIERIVLPLGISFFTFQGMSYVIDVYRRSTPVQTNPLNLALYITFFP